MDKHYRTGWHRPARAAAESPPRFAPGPGTLPDGVPVLRSEPHKPAGGPQLVAEPTNPLESVSVPPHPSPAEYERLYANACHAAAPLIRICEELGRKVGKLRSSVRWDLARIGLELGKRRPQIPSKRRSRVHPTQGTSDSGPVDGS